MNTPILVAYATKYGSTREIAEKIGQVLAQKGLACEVQPVEKVKDIAGYRAVILGSAAYIGNWRKEAVKFIRTFDDELENRPTWLFSSGPLGKGNAKDEMKGWQYPVSLEPVIERIKPRGITVFHGTLKREKMNFLDRWLMRNMQVEARDARRWDLIENWAADIATALK